jgi:hypothetical protein
MSFAAETRLRELSRFRIERLRDSAAVNLGGAAGSVAEEMGRADGWLSVGFSNSGRRVRCGGQRIFVFGI